MGREEERRRGERRRKREKKKKEERDPVKRLAASCGSVLTLQVERVGRPRGGFHQFSAGEREVPLREKEGRKTKGLPRSFLVCLLLSRGEVTTCAQGQRSNKTRN